MEMVETKGLEPSTYWLQTNRSSQLSYVPTGQLQHYIIKKWNCQIVSLVLLDNIYLIKL